jgi:dUTPase
LAAEIDIMVNQDIILFSGQWVLVPTGIALAVPLETYAKITPPSGCVVKHKINIGARGIEEYY